jgi:prevent-host-death family protein
MPMLVSLTQAKLRFDELVEAAEAGEEIIITRWRVPVARIIAVPEQSAEQQMDPSGQAVEDTSPELK